MRDAILASPARPDIAAAMGDLDARGIDVARILLDAHAAGAGVDQAVAAVTTAAAAQAPAPAPAAPAPAAARCCQPVAPGRAVKVALADREDTAPFPLRALSLAGCR
ncbi:hypothetical protein [Streptomyces erythrochromogenes]|uniref:hypothetical protein n=1 Tax=Streptomyces erythrochromogenes TaxID=285574 RepID=UPI0036FE62CE